MIKIALKRNFLQKGLYFFVSIICLLNSANAANWFADPSGAVVAVLAANGANAGNTGWSSTGNAGTFNASSPNIATGDIIVLPTGSYVNITASVTLGGIYFNGGTLNLSSNATTLNVSGNISGCTNFTTYTAASGTGYFTYSSTTKTRIAMTGSNKTLWVNFTQIGSGASALQTKLGTATTPADDGYFMIQGNTTLGGNTNTIGRVLVGNASTACVFTLGGNTLTCDFLTFGTSAGSTQFITGSTGSAINITSTSTATASTLYVTQTSASTQTVSITLNNSSGLTVGNAIVIPTLTLQSGNFTTGSNTATVTTLNAANANANNTVTLGGSSTLGTLNLNSGALTLGASVTVATALNLTAGKITLGANNLTLSNGLTTGSSTAYIVTNSTGNLILPITSGTTALLPIGISSSSYNPITLAAPSASATITAAVSTRSLGVATATDVVNLQWTVKSNAAVTSTITYQFNAANFTAWDGTTGFNTAVAPQLGANYSSAYTLSTLGSVSTTSGVSTTTASSLSIPLDNTNVTTYVIGNSGAIQAASTISGVTLSGSSPYCANSTVTVNFSISGSYSGNTFTAELSNSSGSFASPTSIGTVFSNTAAAITATIPSGTASGTGYRIRVKSSNPGVTSGDNGTDIAINAVGYWIGADQASANTASNWCGNAVPTSATAVVISNSTPKLTANLTVGAMTLNSGINLNGFLLTVSNAATGNGLITGSATSSLTYQSGTLAFDVSNPGTTNALSSLTTTSSSGITLNSSVVVGSLSAAGNITMANGITFKLTGTTYTRSAGVFQAGSNGGATVELANTSGTLTIPSGAFSGTNGNYINLTLSNAGTGIVSTGGNTTCQNLTFNSGILSTTTGTMTVNNTLSGTGTFNSPSTNNIILANGATISNATIATGSGTPVISQTGSTTGIVLNIAGSNSVPPITLSGSNATASAQTMVFAANASLTGSISGLSTARTITGVSTASLTINAATTLFFTTGSATLNTLSIGAASTLSSALTVSNLTLASGLFTNGSNLTLANGATVTVTNGSLSAAPTFGSTVNLVYNGTTSSTGGELPTSSSVLNNLTVNTAAGLTLNAAATVNGTFTLLAGKLTLNGNALSVAALSNGATGSFSSANYIDASSASSSFTLKSVSSAATIFPIGTSATYTPITLTSTTNTPDITVTAAALTLNVSNSANAVNLQWTIKSSVAAKATTTFQFNAANYSGSSFNPADNIELGAYISSFTTTDFNNATGSNPYTLSVSNYDLNTTKTTYVIGNSGSILSPSTIADLAVSGTGTYCAGSTVTVTYSITGSYNSGNVFTAQLSNSIGDFTTPVSIGTVTATTATNISVTLPSNTVTGNGYRIRVVSNNPGATSLDNGTDLIINGAGYWIGADQADANVGSNWCTGSVPTSGTAIVVNTTTPRLSANLTVASATINSGINLNGNTFTVTGAVSGAGSITGSSTSSLSVGSGTVNMDVTTAGTTNVLASFTNSGAVTLSQSLNTPALTIGGNLTLGSSTTLKLTGTSFTRSAGAIQTSSNGNATLELANATGTITIPASAITSTAGNYINLKLSNSSVGIVATTAAITVQNLVFNAGILTTGSTASTTMSVNGQLSGTGTFNMGSTTSRIAMNDGSTIAGATLASGTGTPQIIQNGAVLNFSGTNSVMTINHAASPTTQTMVLAAASSLSTASTGLSTSKTISGNATANLAISSGNLYFTSGASTLNNLTINGNTFIGTAGNVTSVTVNGTMSTPTATSSNINISTGSTVTLASGATISMRGGGIVNSGTLSTTAYNLTYAGTVAQTTTTTELPSTLNGTLTIANAAGVTLANSTSVNGLTLTSGKLTPAAGVTFTLPATISVTSGSIDASTNTTSVIAIVNTTTTIPASTFNPATISNLSVTNAVVTLNQNVSVTTSLTLNSTNASDYTFTNGTKLTLASGSSYTYNQTSTGSVTLSATPTYAGTANFNYSGSTAITMGNEAPASTAVINNLTINNAAGVTLNQTNNAVVNGTLTLTSGSITLDNSNLVLAGSTTVAGTPSASKYIKTTGTGVLTINGVGSTAVTFPIGTATSYAPLSIANAASTSTNLSASVGSTITSTPIDATRVINLQWSVLSSASTSANITFQFNNADKASGYTTGTNELGVFTSNPNYATYVVTTSGSNPYTTTKTGLAIPTSGNNFFVIGNTGAVELPSTTWIGAVSTAWTLAANWNNGLPSSTIDAVIPATIKSPVISAATTVSRLTVSSFAIVNNNSTLTVVKDFTNNGTISGGTITLGGTTNQAISGNGSVNNFTLNNAAGASVATGASNNLQVKGILTLQTGTLTTNGNVTLKSSSIANSAIVAPVGTSGNNGKISGTVQVERFIPKGYRAWRDIAPSVFNAGSIFNNWQEAGSYANAGYGLFITGTTAVSNAHAVDATTGLDQTTNSVKSAYTFTNGTWNAVTNTKNTNLNPFLGYRLLVRGDRSFDLFTTPISTIGTTGWLLMNAATTLRAKGNLITGNVVYGTSGITNTVAGSSYNNASFGLNSSSTTGFSSVANPYVAPIDWKNIWDNGRAVNLTANYYYLDPTLGSSGAYVSYNAVTDATSNGAIGSRRYIQAGQAFFVENNNSAAPSLTITEADKTIGSTKTAVFGTANRNRLTINLMKATGSELKQMDGATIMFDQRFSNGIGQEDARKMTNPGENLAIDHVGQSLSIEGRQPATADDQIAFHLSQLSSGEYHLSIDASAFKAENLAVYLMDALDKSEILLTSSINNLRFTADAGNPKTYTNRFSVVFKAVPKAVITNAPKAATSMSVYPNPMVGKTVTVRLGSEIAADKYEVCMYNSLGQIMSKSIINHSGTNSAFNITQGRDAMNCVFTKGVYQLTLQSTTNNKVVATTTLAVE